MVAAIKDKKVGVTAWPLLDVASANVEEVVFVGEVKPESEPEAKPDASVGEVGLELPSVRPTGSAVAEVNAS